MKMRAILIASVIFILVCLFMPFASTCWGKEDNCELVKRDLEVKRGILSDYVAALKKAKADAPLKGLLRHKVDELTEQIAHLEAALADCVSEQAAEVPEQLSTVKSDENPYASKNCSDLRKMLVQLLRKLNALQRRENSLFSELSPAEKAELEQSRRDLNLVRAMLRSRCSQPPASNSTRKPRR